MRKVFLLSAVLLLAACGSPTPYQPALDGYGFQEQQIEGNRYRVSFSGNSLTPRATVEDYLLYRAAELTLAQGADFFILADRDTETSTRYYGGTTGFGGFGGFGFGGYGRSRSSVFTGVSVDSGEPSTRYHAYADIVIYGGEKPNNEAKAYDARDVIARLGPRIRRPTDETAK